MTTRAPVMVLAVSLGAIQMTRQPEATRRVMSFCPSACWVPLYRPSKTITRMRVEPGRARPSAPSRALTARVKSSYLPAALNSATWAGTAPGQVTGRTSRPQVTVAGRAGGCARAPARRGVAGGGGGAGGLAVARASIQAVEATGPVKPLIEPDTSQATPTARGGAGTRRRSTLVKEIGSAH